MPRFVPKSPADLALLRAGICPACGAALAAGAAACGGCRLELGEHAAHVSGPVAVASGPPAPSPPSSSARAPAAPASGSGAPRPLTTTDIDELERGLFARRLEPSLSIAAAPDREPAGTSSASSALARAAHIVAADAALADEPAVLMGWSVLLGPIARAALDDCWSQAGLVDDPAFLLASRTSPAAAPATEVEVRRPAPPSTAVDPRPLAQSSTAPERAAIAGRSDRDGARRSGPPRTLDLEDTAPLNADAVKAAIARVDADADRTQPHDADAIAAAVEAFDPDKTAPHDADAVAALMRAAKEQLPSVAARGRAQRLRDK